VDHVLRAHYRRLQSRNFEVGAQHVGDELVPAEEALILPQRELVGVVRPPDVDAGVRRIETINTPCPLFSRANDARHVQVHHRGGALQVESF
jgi:hypothetical protein